MMNNMTPVVKQLLIINIIVFIAAQIPQMSDRIYHLFSLYYFENPDFRIWQPITSMFMHATIQNIYHIVFNMIALVSFGSILEHFWGAKKFLIFYFVCGIGAFLMHTGVNYYFFHQGLDLLTNNGFSQDQILATLGEGKFNPKWQEVMSSMQFSTFTDAYFGTAVGASGAIYGLLVAFAVMMPNAQVSLFFFLPFKAKYIVPAIIAIDIFMGINGNSLFGDNSGGGIAHFAHIGGALFGFIMMLIWRNKKFQHKRWN